MENTQSNEIYLGLRSYLLSQGYSKMVGTCIMKWHLIRAETLWDNRQVGALDTSAVENHCCRCSGGFESNYIPSLYGG